MNLAEKRLRQYINESLVHMAAAAAASQRVRQQRAERERAERERAERERATSGNNKKYSRRSRFPSRSTIETDEQKKAKRVSKRQGDCNHFPYAVSEYYRHIIDEHPDHIKDWKEWLYKYIEDYRKTYSDTNQIIKKVGNKYVIDEDLISKASNYDDETDELFSRQFVEKLEKRYKKVARQALEYKMQNPERELSLKNFYSSL